MEVLSEPKREKLTPFQLVKLMMDRVKSPDETDSPKPKVAVLAARQSHPHFEALASEPRRCFSLKEAHCFFTPPHQPPQAG